MIKPHWGMGAGLVVLLAPAAAGEDAPKQREVLSAVHFVDQKYKSMEGPVSAQAVTLQDGNARELLWLTGFGTQMVEADGSTPVSMEFLCHANVQVNPDIHEHGLGLPPRNFGSRLFTNSQGQPETRFPDGFGLPVMSDEQLMVQAQVVNNNVEVGEAGLKMRHKLTLQYVRDRDLATPMKPLFLASANVMVSLEGHEAYVGTRTPGEHEHGSTCLPGETAGTGMGQKSYVHDSLGQKFTGHWVVKPGRHEYRTLVTELLDLKFDTTIHFISVHVHPFAEYIELRDLTSGTSLFRSNVKNYPGRIGLEHVDTLSSPEGIPVYADHDYEMVVAYDNRSGVDQDSMAVMYLYLLDKAFRRDAIPAAATN